MTAKATGHEIATWKGRLRGRRSAVTVSGSITFNWPSRTRTCTSNATIARCDWLTQSIFVRIPEVQAFETDSLWMYNDERPNMALGGITPRVKAAMTA